MGACYDVSSLPHQATDRSLCNRMSTWYRQNRARCMHGKISPTPFDNVTATLAKVWRLYSVARSLSKRRYNWSFWKVRAFDVCLRFSLVFFCFQKLVYFYSTSVVLSQYIVHYFCCIFWIFHTALFHIPCYIPCVAFCYTLLFIQLYELIPYSFRLIFCTIVTIFSVCAATLSGAYQAV